MDIDSIFYGLITKQMKVEPDLSKWLNGGSATEPVVKDRALQRARDCYEKALTFLDDIDVWEVEYDASGTLPGLSVPIKAYVDIIGEHKKHGIVILDWKTGANKPKDNFQLETYKALLDHGGNIFEYGDIFREGHPVKGLWAMLAPQARKARPIDLSTVSPEEVGAKYQAVYEKMQRKLYPTNAGFDCKFCFQSPNCLLDAGQTARAKFYDRASEDGCPF